MKNIHVLPTDKQSFVAGAKSDAARDYWFKQFQQEQDKSKYSEEEVIAFVKWMYDYKADINKVEELFKPI
jgi:hypothetical protein